VNTKQMVCEALTNIENNCADIEKYGGGTFVIRENYNQGRYDAYLTVLESLRLEEKQASRSSLKS